ncbi:hypothetical protein ACGFZB_25190 [Streptomyces cinerochromogenes]|uniref:Uncharacterized protein n=1 Tax=Streptomyces cinerochromogenes TaxID=66422 RepID=A0ABW7BD48_9ACTN
MLHAVALAVVSASLFLFAVSGGVHGGQWPAAREVLVRMAAKPAFAVLVSLGLLLLLLSGTVVASALVPARLAPDGSGPAPRSSARPDGLTDAPTPMPG